MSKLKSKALKRALALILSGTLIMSGVTVYGEGNDDAQVQTEQNQENGGASKVETTEEESSEEESTEEESSEEESTEEETTEEETTEEETTEEETTEEETTEEETTEEETTEEETIEEASEIEIPFNIDSVVDLTGVEFTFTNVDDEDDKVTISSDSWTVTLKEGVTYKISISDDSLTVTPDTVVASKDEITVKVEGEEIVAPKARTTANENAYVFDAETELSSYAKKGEVAATTFANYFDLVGTKSIRANSDTYALELAKCSGSSLEFTVASGTANVEIDAASTGSSNKSLIALLDEKGNAVTVDSILDSTGKEVTQDTYSDGYIISGSNYVTLSYSSLEAGTYKIVSPGDSSDSGYATYNRGVRVKTVSVEIKADVVVTSSEYKFDAETELSSYAKKGEVAATTFANYFDLVGTKSIRANSDTYALELAKCSGSSLEFTVASGTANVEIDAASTGSSNKSLIALLDEKGNAVTVDSILDSTGKEVTQDTYSDGYIISGSNYVTLSYSSLEVGTYKIVSPGDSSDSGYATYNRGVRVKTVSVVVNGNANSTPAERKDWNEIDAPTISGVSINATDENKIDVNVEAVVGYDGGDSLVVYMYNDANEEISNSTIKAKNSTHTVSFTPEKSGKYYFKAVLTRSEMDNKISENSEIIEFWFPLSTPSFSSATSIGGGKVEFEWGAVKEAESYVIEVKDSDKTATFTETTGTIEGLTVGEKYTFYVYAVRGEDKSEKGEISVTVTADEQAKWSFSAYGSSTSASKDGYSGSLADNNLKVWSTSNGGKLVPNSTDGLAFYYTEVPSNQNFTFEATVSVDSWTFSNGQEGFGIMAADRVGENGSGAAFWNNSYMAMISKVEYYWDGSEVTDDTTASKITMKLGVGSIEKQGVTEEGLAELDAGATIPSAFTTKTTTLETSCAQYGVGEHNIVGNCTNSPSGTKSEITEFKLKIQKNNTGYFVSYTDPDGNTTTQKYYDTEALSQLDSDTVYVGFFASRNATISVKDYSLTTIDPADDAPAEGRVITYLTPSYQILSATVANTPDYELVFYSNWAGSLLITDKNGKEVLKDENVKAETKVKTDVTLSLGNNDFNVTFIPDKDYAPNDYTQLSSYDEKTFVHTVKFNNYGEEGQSIYVSNTGSSSNNGTKASPLDIYTAVKYVQPGQMIVLMEGTYNLTSTVKVERGIDGTADKMICMIADPEASSRPVLDFGGNCAGMILAGDYWYFKGFDVTNSANAQKGIQVSGSHNVLDQINTYKNGNTGIQIARYKTTDSGIGDGWPEYNLILNCTSYLNADAGYEDADGFAAKLTIGEGNVFDGCISAYNADDGWDCFAKAETGPIGKVTIRNCIAYKNGYVLLNDAGELDINGHEVSAGNGNGFKMGGESITGHHEVSNSIAFYNKAKGIDSNSCPDIQAYNTVTYNNESYNVAFYTNNAKNTDFKASGVVSFRTDFLNVAEQLKPVGTQDTTQYQNDKNYFWDTASQTSKNTEGVTVSESWFKSLDFSLVDKNFSRNADGTINMNGFLEISEEGSKYTTASFGGTASRDIAVGEEVSAGTYDYSSSYDDSDSGSSDDDSSATVTTSTAVVDESLSAIPPMLPVSSSSTDTTVSPATSDTINLDISKTKGVLNIALVNDYYGKYSMIAAHLGNGIGVTINNANISAGEETTVNVGATIVDVPNFAQGFETKHIVPTKASALPFEIYMHVNVGVENVGKKAYVFKLNSVGKTYELSGVMDVNAIGNIAIQTTEMTDIIILIQD